MCAEYCRREGEEHAQGQRRKTLKQAALKAASWVKTITGASAPAPLPVAEAIRPVAANVLHLPLGVNTRRPEEPETRRHDGWLLQNRRHLLANRLTENCGNENEDAVSGQTWSMKLSQAALLRP